LQHYAFPIAYLGLLGLYFALFYQEFWQAWSYPKLLIAPIMSLGSFVAGATFLGGGAVAFPALTKILGSDPATAKTFSLAIQSIGMTSAAFFIAFRLRLAIPWLFILWYLLGSITGLFFCLWTLEGTLSATDTRIGFTLFIICFFAMYLWTYKSEHYDEAEHGRLTKAFYRNVKTLQLVVICGFIGGLVSGLIGSGADLIAFCLLALFFRVDIKTATQISVIIMAITSVFGFAFQGLIQQNIAPQVWQLWYIAAPVVLIGAPLGALFCSRISASGLLIFIVCIVACEVVSTTLLISIEPERIKVYVVAVFALLFALKQLHRFSPYHQTNLSTE